MTIELLPGRDILGKEGAEIKLFLQGVLVKAHALSMDNEDAFKFVTGLYRNVRDWKKIIEEKRKAATEPFRTQQAFINDKAKELTDPLSEIEKITKLKAEEYQKHLECLKKAEEEEVREAAAILDIAEHELYIAPVAPTIRGEGAMAYTVTEKRFKLADISKVPAKYLKLDEIAIKQDIKLGLNEIPGLEIFEEQVTKLRSR